MTRKEEFSRLLKEISIERKKIERVIRKALRRKGDRRSLTAIAVLSPSTLHLPDLPFPQNLQDVLNSKEYDFVQSVWERLQNKMREVMENYDDILESYRRQVFTHYLRKLNSNSAVVLTEDQKQDLYQSLNVGICKAFLCYDHEKEKENPAKFFLKVMRGILRTYLSGEVLGISVPPTQYQKKVSRGEEIPLVVPISQIVPEPTEEENNDEPLEFPFLDNVPSDWLTEMEIRDVINRLPPVFKQVLLNHIEGEENTFPSDVGVVLLSVSILTVISLLRD